MVLNMERTDCLVDEYYTPVELAVKFNVSIKSIRTWTQLRKIPGQVKIGRIWRYKKAAVEKNLILHNSLFIR